MRWLPIIGILIIIVTIIIFTVDGIRSAIRTSKKRRELLKSGSSVPASPVPKTGRTVSKYGIKKPEQETTDVSSVLSRFGKNRKV